MIQYAYLVDLLISVLKKSCGGLCSPVDAFQSSEWHRFSFVEVCWGRRRRKGPPSRATEMCRVQVQQRALEFEREEAGRRFTVTRLPVLSFIVPANTRWELFQNLCIVSIIVLTTWIEHPGACVRPETHFCLCTLLGHSNWVATTRALEDDHKLAFDDRERLLLQETLPVEILLYRSLCYLCSIWIENIVWSGSVLNDSL